MTHSPGYLAHQLAATIDARDWDGVRRLLADDCIVRLVHDNRSFGADEWVEFNADYPGQWSFVAEDIVAQDAVAQGDSAAGAQGEGDQEAVKGGRAVLRARVFNESAVFHVASFLTVAHGLITEIVEVWADGHAAPTEE